MTETSHCEVEISQVQPKAAAKSIRKSKLKNAAEQESDFELDEPTGDVHPNSCIFSLSQVGIEQNKQRVIYC